jgi:S1-C subfamily serine protease
VRHARRSQLLVAVVSAVASALVVCAIFLAAGAFEDEPEGERRAAAAARTVPAASPRDVYARTRLGVVLIDHRPPGVKPRTGAPTRDDGVATGSGFFIDRQGHVVTNQHIVAGRGRTTVQFDPGAKPVAATILGRDESTDLALVKVDPADAPARLTALALGDSDTVRIGDPALAIGNPLGLERSLSVGVVSATGRTINATNRAKIRGAVQTDAPINPGNSGGPLLDARGRVIGVISQGRGAGIAFAIPVDTVKRIVAKFRRRS